MFLEVVLKTVERCNLNCSYCYFFNGQDQQYRKHPPFIQLSTIEASTRFLLEGIQGMNLQKLQIHLHGGEPLLQRKTDFDHMCAAFSSLADHINLSFSIQTNGLLIDEEWIELFQKYRIHIGVSVDGPKEYHDQFRLDHRGKGSYDKTLKGIELLKQAKQKGQISSFGVLCVINPLWDASKIYSHFTRELGIEKMDFLLPDYNQDNFTGSADAYGTFLCQLFDAWMKEERKGIFIRFFASILDVIINQYVPVPMLGNHRIITIASNGDLSPDDSLRGSNPEFMNTGLNVKNSSLNALFDQPIFKFLDQFEKQLPLECQTCCWERICHGGSFVHRYSQSNQFDNPSILCIGLKRFYRHLVKTLLQNGFPQEKINEALFGAAIH